MTAADPRGTTARALARKRKKRAKERGIALVMVMGAIAILTVMLAEFQDETSAELAAATSQRDAVQAEYIARSAVNLSRLLIASEPTIRKAIAPLFMMMKKTPPQLPVWEFHERILFAFNSLQASDDGPGGSAVASSLGVDLNQGKNLGMPGGRFELSIIDEDSKINVNLGAANEFAHIRLAQELMGLTAQPQYAPLFEQKDGTGQFHDRYSTCQALIDWADSDEQAFNCDLTQTSGPQQGGVEDAYYQLLPKPYRRKNAPYDSLEELHMVKGVHEDFWSTFIDPDPKEPRKRVITVWGQGAINVNTANAQTLLAVVCAGAPAAEICTLPEQAQTFLMGVTMARGVTMGAPLFGSPRDFVSALTGQGQLGPLLAGFGMKPVVFRSPADFQKSITTESKMFSIYAVGVKKGYRRETRVRVHAVVDFRAAPAIGATPGLPGATPGLPGATGLPGSTPAAGGAAAAGPNAIAAANAPSTGGQVVYFRLE